MKALVLALCLFSFVPNRATAQEVLELDGTWEILFDPHNSGRDAGWHLDKNFSSNPERREIPVPSCWEEIEKDYEGVAFYRRAFQVPQDWAGKTVRLHFDAVNFMAEVWLNDQAVGFHEGGFTPFAFRVDRMIKAGQKNTVTLRVAGPILLQDKRIEGVGPMETPQWRGAIAGGIWQPVRLIATGDVYVKDVFIEPKIADDTATFHVELEHSGLKHKTAHVDITIREVNQPDRIVAQHQESLELQPGSNQHTWALTIPNAVYWSPDNPHLYRAELTVATDDTISDRWTSRFGLREFTVRDKQFYLNGKPIYLKATFFEGLYPAKLAYPDSKAMASQEIRLAKSAGFNMIRPWRKPPPPLWLDLAEEMGVMTVGSLAIECMDFPVETARLPGWVENEVRQSILRDRNRTSVVQWELFNELKRPVLKQLLHPMAMLARQLDPTRVILDESGGWAQGANLYLPYESEPTKFNDIHYYPGPQINEDVYNSLLIIGKTEQQQQAMGIHTRMPGRNVLPGLMSFISELGYGSLPDLVACNERFAQVGNPIVPPTIYYRRLADQHRRALKESGFDRVYTDLRQFCLDQQQIHGTANKRMIEAARSNPDIHGYCIHALVAGDWIVGAGLLDLFRNPKTYAYEGTKAASQPRILPIRVRPRNVYAERGTHIEVTGVNELAEVRGTLTVAVIAANGRTAFSKTVEADLVSGITSLFVQQLDTHALQGTYTVQARLTAADGSLFAENAYDFDVFTAEQMPVPRNRIAVLDPTHSLTPFLKNTGASFVDFNSTVARTVPVFVSRTVARNPKDKQRFAQLIQLVKTGGTAVYLQGSGPGANRWNQSPSLVNPLLPVRVRPKAARGLWTCIPHIVHEHPIFDGLPTNCMMGPVYENVWAPNTLLDIGGEAIVGAIGFDWFPNLDRRQRHYYGPGDTWWGADMAIVPFGKGRLIVSQLRLLDHLGKDPVADKILYNLMTWTTGERN